MTIPYRTKHLLDRPITVVSGPEIMDKFVGSSEMKLREIFDSPPDIYAQFRSLQGDNGEAIAKAVRAKKSTFEPLDFIRTHALVLHFQSLHVVSTFTWTRFKFVLDKWSLT